MGAECEAQVKNNQVSSKRGYLHLTARVGCAILSNRLKFPSGPGAGDGPHWCRNKWEL